MARPKQEDRIAALEARIAELETALILSVSDDMKIGQPLRLAQFVEDFGKARFDSLRQCSVVSRERLLRHMLGGG